MELRTLRYFVAVAEEEHVTRAARRLHVAQPALSRTIQKLEREVGVELFVRTRRRGLELTPAGTDFLGHARELLAQVECAVGSARRVARGLGGDLQVGFVEAALYSGALPDAVRRVREAAPDAEVHLHEGSSLRQVDELYGKGLDVGLLYMAPPADDAVLTVERLWDEPLTLVLPAAHPLAADPSAALGGLGDEPLVLFRRELAPEVFDAILRACRTAGYVPARVQETDRFHNVVGLVAGGVGVGLAPWSMRALGHPGVAYQPVPELAIGFGMHLVMRRDNPLPLAELFAEQMRAAARRHPVARVETGRLPVAAPA